MSSPQFVVWGARADMAGGTPIKLMGGTVAECRSETAYRGRLGGWTLGTFPDGVMPSESWLKFARESAQAPENVPCFGCFRFSNDHAAGCPTGQNGSPRYN